MVNNIYSIHKHCHCEHVSMLMLVLVGLRINRTMFSDALNPEESSLYPYQSDTFED